MLAETPIPTHQTDPQTAARPQRKSTVAAYYLPPALLMAAAMLFHVCTVRTPVFPVDDAYITLHNAQVLHWGHDPNFGNTPALAGATSPAHLAMVALLMFLLPPLWALDAAAWLGCLAFAVGIARLARAHGMPPGPTFLLVIAGLLAARAPQQLMNGLETGWAMAGVTWALALASDERPARPTALAAVCGLLPFLRPELAALSALLLPLPAWRAWKSGNSPRESLMLMLRCGGVALAAAAPWLAWQFAATGSIIPATIVAKRYYFAESAVSAEVKWAWVIGSFTALMLACGPLAAAALALPFTAVGRVAMLFTAALLAAYYLQFPGALTHAQGRYLYVLLPFLLVGAASAFEMTIFALAAAAQAALLAPFTWREHAAEQIKTRRDLAGVASWCTGNLPAGSRLLIHDAGYISYATSFPMQDIVGLKTPANIAFHRVWTYPTHGANRAAAIDAAARRSGAKYLIVLDLWDGLFKITSGLHNHGWTVEPLRINGDYHVYRITPPRP